MECDGQFFVILNTFCPFTPLTTQKNQDFEKMTETPEDIILHMCTLYDNHDVWFLKYGAWQAEFFVILDCFLPFYPA